MGVSLQVWRTRTTTLCEMVGRGRGCRGTEDVVDDLGVVFVPGTLGWLMAVIVGHI